MELKLLGFRLNCCLFDVNHFDENVNELGKIIKESKLNSF